MYTVDALLVTAVTILFGHYLRSILLSKLKMATNSAATIQERLLITHLRYFVFQIVCTASPLFSKLVGKKRGCNII